MTSPLRVLVSAGPTREPIDDVRFLSNRSSGRMGFAIAAAAAGAGCLTHLVAGPVTLPTPSGVIRHDVETAVEMFSALKNLFGEIDLLIMAAAVADYRPREVFAGKHKRQADRLILELVANPDLLLSLAGTRQHQTLVGFALETSADHQEARRKLHHKRIDAIILNQTRNLEDHEAEGWWISADETQTIPRCEKPVFAKTLLDLSFQLHSRRQRPHA